MSDCPTITKKFIYVAPADTGIDLELTAPSAGNYLVQLEFNGTYIEFTLTLEQDDDIILPNIVNGEYNHMLRLYKPDNSLLNDTCYLLHCRTVTGNGNGLTPSPQAKTWKIITVAQNAETLTDVFFATNTISEITTEGQSYLAGVDFTQTGDTITGLTIAFSVGQILKAQV